VDAITLKLSNFILQGAKSHMTDLEFLEKKSLLGNVHPVG
jgi:hypothetical protein